MFTLFKTSRTHMFLACRLVAPAPSHVIGPDGVVAVRSQQDLLAGKDGKEVTGARPGGNLYVARVLGACGLAHAGGTCSLAGTAGLCWGASETLHTAGLVRAPSHVRRNQRVEICSRVFDWEDPPTGHSCST